MVPNFIMVRRFVCATDPESYAGGSVVIGRGLPCQGRYQTKRAILPF